MYINTDYETAKRLITLQQILKGPRDGRWKPLFLVTNFYINKYMQNLGSWLSANTAHDAKRLGTLP